MYSNKYLVKLVGYSDRTGLFPHFELIFIFSKATEANRDFYHFY